MKKKLFIVAGTLIMSVAVTTLSSMNSSSSLEIFVNDVDVLTDTETKCTSSSGTNNGNCEKRIDGLGDACVVNTGLFAGNCDGQIDVKK